METQRFRGIERSKLLSISDKGLQRFLFSPTSTDFIEIGGIFFLVFMIYPFFSYFAIGMEGNLFSSLMAIFIIIGCVIFLIALALAAKKKSYPFLMTTIGTELEIECDKTKLNTFKIAGKTAEKRLGSLNGVMIREFESGYCIVSIYYLSFILGRLGSSYLFAGKVVVAKKDAEKIADRLGKFTNLRAERSKNDDMIVVFR